MSSVPSIPPVSIPYSSQAAAPLPVPALAPLAGGSALAADTITIGSTGVAETENYQETVIQLAQATPQQLALLAANGNAQAKRILSQQAAVQQLLSPAGITA